MADNANLKKELKDIDNRIDTLKKNIALGKDLESLHEDERFINVILKAYLEAEAERIFGVLTDSSHNLKRDVMENLMDKMTSVRNIKQFFATTLMNASMAPEEIETEEAYRLEVTGRDTDNLTEDK